MNIPRLLAENDRLAKALRRAEYLRRERERREWKVTLLALSTGAVIGVISTAAVILPFCP